VLAVEALLIAVAEKGGMTNPRTRGASPLHRRDIIRAAPPNDEARMTILAGVDGCCSGWVVVTQDTASGRLAWQVVESIAEYLPGNPIPTVMAIDVPTGLPESGPRACYQATRARLGPRRSSVFPAPIRAVLAARSQQEASVIGRGRRRARHQLPVLEHNAEDPRDR
jgi:hypothetical protein